MSASRSLDLFTARWAATVEGALERDAAFASYSRALRGALYLHDEADGITLHFDRGRVTAVVPGADPYGTRWRIGGTRRAWLDALRGEADLFQATDARCGVLALEGDAMGVAGNAMAFARLWLALRAASAEGDGDA